MLDVHPPHGSIHHWRDFLLHLIAITIGLLIALGLEGLVEWQHHRHLVHEAEASLQAEIQSNAKGLAGAHADIRKQSEILKQDVSVLKQIIKDRKEPKESRMEINYSIRGFDDVSWKTAQSTGVLSYMPYAKAEQYAEIYKFQEEIDIAQHRAVRDAILSLAPFSNMSDKETPNPEEAVYIKQHIEILQGELLLLDSLVTALDGSYKKFLAAHPG